MDDPGMNIELLTAHMVGQPSPILDTEHMRQLTMFHYIVGALIAAFASVFIIHVVMGLTLLNHPSVFPAAPGAPPFPREAGYLFVIMGGIAVLGGWTLGGLTAYAGRCIRDRKNHTLIFVIAGLNCFFAMPLGTILGVFTFVVLSRPAVQEMFKPGPASRLPT